MWRHVAGWRFGFLRDETIVGFPWAISGMKGILISRDVQRRCNCQTVNVNSMDGLVARVIDGIIREYLW